MHGSYAAYKNPPSVDLRENEEVEKIKREQK
jgi:hypothetical protein